MLIKIVSTLLPTCRLRTVPLRLRGLFPNCKRRSTDWKVWFFFCVSLLLLLLLYYIVWFAWSDRYREGKQLLGLVKIFFFCKKTNWKNKFFSTDHFCNLPLVNWEEFWDLLYIWGYIFKTSQTFIIINYLYLYNTMETRILVLMYI